MKKTLLGAAAAVALTVGGLVPLGGLSPAGADPAITAAASGYGTNVNLAGTAVVDQAGLATATLPPGEIDGPNSLVLVPGAPIAVSGTAAGLAGAHVASDLTTTLQQNTQAVQGPYNAVGVGLTEGLSVLTGATVPLPPLPPLGVELVSASAVRGEAVGVCRNGAPVYSANSEIIDLNIAGTDVPLNGPVTDLVDTLNTVLAPLGSIIDINRNEVVVTSDGAAVNALHVTLLGLGGEPLLDLIVGHAEVRGLTCAPVPECSDTQDNDGDGVIDANDPGCINNGVYDPNDDDERNQPPATPLPNTDALPRTGGDLSTTAPIAVGLSVLALAALALRRRSQT